MTMRQAVEAQAVEAQAVEAQAVEAQAVEAQAVEAQVATSHCELGEHGLRQVLSDVIEEVQQSVGGDIDGAEILHRLLNSSWLQSLLKVYESLQRFLRAAPPPALDFSSGLSLQACYYQIQHEKIT